MLRQKITNCLQTLRTALPRYCEVSNRLKSGATQPGSYINSILLSASWSSRRTLGGVCAQPWSKAVAHLMDTARSLLFIILGLISTGYPKLLQR